MSFKQSFFITLLSAGMGGVATLATSYFTSVSLALPGAEGNSPSSVVPIPCSPVTDYRPRLGPIESMQVESEFDYLSKMIRRHEEAITAAKLLKEGTNRREMRKFADEIIQVQSAEMAKMQVLRDRWYPPRKAEVAYTPTMRDLTNLRGDDLDKAFLEDMRMLSKGAIVMSQRLLSSDLAKHDEVKALAEEITSARGNEINQIQAWQQTWFGATGTIGDGGLTDRRNGVKK